MKKRIIMICAAVAAVVSASCSKTVSPAAEGQLVQLNCEIAIDGSHATKASEDFVPGSGSMINKVVCAVFEGATELAALRKEFDRNEDGTFPAYQPSLYIGKEYTVVFWAYNSEACNLEQFPQIALKRMTNDERADAFAYSEKVTVSDELIKSGMIAELKRPFAQINVGVPYDEANFLVTHSQISFSQVYTSYNVLTKQPCGEPVSGEYASGAILDYKYNVTETDADGNSVEVTYKNVSLSYVLPGENMAVEVKVAKSEKIDEDLLTNLVVSSEALSDKVGENCQTTIHSDFLKGELSFSVSFGDFFGTDDITISNE